MPKESPLTQLREFMPEESLEEVIQYLQHYKVHLTITRDRRSILGNFRSKALNKNHRITVNGSLNKYSFLITLLHELAHLVAYEKYGHRIQPHGKEWKTEFGKIQNKDFKVREDRRQKIHYSKKVYSKYCNALQLLFQCK